MHSRTHYLIALIYAGAVACVVTASIAGLWFSPKNGAELPATLDQVFRVAIPTLFLSIFSVPLGLFGAIFFLAGPFGLAMRKPSKGMFVAMGILGGLAHTVAGWLMFHADLGVNLEVLLGGLAPIIILVGGFWLFAVEQVFKLAAASAMGGAAAGYVFHWALGRKS